jgi:prolyl-tRNA editing enzyme YbaK/EbsC (Cys-tRNA(Pro) deacylase)
MSAPTILDRPHAGLLDWLRKHDVDHEVHEHPEAFTARQTASAEGVDPATFAKVVLVGTADGRSVMLLVDAIDQVDLHKARHALETTDVRLLTEPEAATLTPGCAIGAAPAVGALFDLPMVADHAVREDSGDQLQRRQPPMQRSRGSRGVGRETGVVYADLAIDDDIRPRGREDDPWATPRLDRCPRGGDRRPSRRRSPSNASSPMCPTTVAPPGTCATTFDPAWWWGSAADRREPQRQSTSCASCDSGDRLPVSTT